DDEHKTKFTTLHIKNIRYILIEMWHSPKRLSNINQFHDAADILFVLHHLPFLHSLSCLFLIIQAFVSILTNTHIDVFLTYLCLLVTFFMAKVKVLLPYIFL
ncbi:hypothetical protein ACJX0J_028998, partial [Zea mays]